MTLYELLTGAGVALTVGGVALSNLDGINESLQATALMETVAVVNEQVEVIHLHTGQELDCSTVEALFADLNDQSADWLDVGANIQHAPDLFEFEREGSCYIKVKE